MSEKRVEVIEAYEASLEVSPNRFNSLFGVASAAKLAGDLEKAKLCYTKLMQLAADADGTVTIGDQLSHQPAYFARTRVLGSKKN